MRASSLAVATPLLAAFAISVLASPLPAAEPATAKCEDESCQTTDLNESRGDDYDQIRGKLARTMTVRYDGVPFHVALVQFAKETRLDIVLDRLEPKHHNITINLVLDRAPAKAVLAQLLNQNDEELSYAIRDGFVLIATRERLDKIQEARVYRSTELPSVTAGLPLASIEHADAARTDRFRELLSTIEPHSWDASGGQGRVAFVGGNLVVWQTPRVHQQLADLFAELCTAEADRYRELEQRSPTVLAPMVAPTKPTLPLPVTPSTLKPAND